MSHRKTYLTLGLMFPIVVASLHYVFYKGLMKIVDLIFPDMAV